ncbi:regulatory protein RecX [Leucobacter weissii]|uniref:Regulatory protein RecX n=1 Tax=Leucobacter weissii TaxID=1983706 RepID=A0A939MK81_9MICO|nr:regulatory protein RecX [Leucobacter weissii]MBO1902101.1 regulatory protein RecX [Leucobacter weissii]
MVVRFLPANGSAEGGSGRRERERLAEVIELRSRLPRTMHAEAADAVEDRDGDVEARRTPHDGSSAGDGSVGEDAIAGAHGTDAEDTKGAAVRLLARRARSSGELRRELLRSGHDARDVDAVILEFEGSLYLDDLGLARTVAEAQRERKRASLAQIRRKLRERLVPDGIIEEVLGEFDDGEERELLRQAADARAQRLADLDRRTAERRLLGFLARRGWSGEHASRVAREAIDRAQARGTVSFR